MKIWTAEQTRDLDAYTIQQEPIASIDLMERAAHALFEWFCKTFPDKGRPVFLICGQGNNGGDGLALARMLYRVKYSVTVWICDIGKPSTDFTINQNRLPGPDWLSQVHLQTGHPFPKLPKGSVVVDALFGTGINRPLEGFPESIIHYLNSSPVTRVALDIPSGLAPDRPSEGICFHAHYTFTFQSPKLSFFFPENQDVLGHWTVGDIQLSRQRMEQLETPFHYLTANEAKQLRIPRATFSHKGNFGHALLIAGSRGKIGAGILAASGCLRSGIGLLTIQVPGCGYSILQQSVPEAMVIPDTTDAFISNPVEYKSYTAVGIGPGIGQQKATAEVLLHLLNQFDHPIVLDADALNLLSQHPKWWSDIPPGSILTPHPGEFKRLFGPQKNGFGQLEIQREASIKHQVYIVLKGAYTSISGPDGKVWFNSTGNPGMATGGAGDVLTGILTALLAQGYDSEDAAKLGVFLHGLAGDLAVGEFGQEALIAGDLTTFLGKAFQQLDRL